MPVETPIAHVTDTAFWIAQLRAEESKRPDALFQDPLAAKLVVGREHIAKEMDETGVVAWAAVIRTVIIDALLQDALANGFDTVLNLGAGLDTRPYRMNLPSNLRWFEADFPSTIALKEERLAGDKPRCQLKRFAADLSSDSARREILREVASGAKKAVVLTEGVVPYLSLEDAANLAKDLHHEAAYQRWIIDRFSKRFMALRDRMPHHRRLGNAPFRFIPPDWDAFFLSNGWKRTTTKFLPAESRRIGRPSPVVMPLWARAMVALLPSMRREMEEMTGYVVLERV